MSLSSIDIASYTATRPANPRTGLDVRPTASSRRSVPLFVRVCPYESAALRYFL